MKIDFHISESRVMDGVIIPTLCHSDRVVEVVSGNEDVSACDALITLKRGISLGITTADCVAVCFGNDTKIAIAHIGWRGLCLGLIEKMLGEFDTNALEVFVGPHLHVFEIQKDRCYETIKSKFGETFFTHEDDKILFHFKDAIASLLPLQAIFDDRNTGEDMTLPSWRRDQTSKRLITVVQFSNSTTADSV